MRLLRGLKQQGSAAAISISISVFCNSMSPQIADTTNCLFHPVPLCLSKAAQDMHLFFLLALLLFALRVRLGLCLCG